MDQKLLFDEKARQRHRATLKGAKEGQALGLVSLGAIFMSPQRPTDESRLSVIPP